MISGFWKKGTEDLSDAHVLRTEVFVHEQGIAPELEFTNDDDRYMHLVVYDQNNAPIATGRMERISDEKVHMGRICVKKEERGNHIGEFLMKIMLDKAFMDGASKAVVEAQESAAGFYRALGFEDLGEIPNATGIKHHLMEADLAALRSHHCHKKA